MSSREATSPRFYGKYRGRVVNVDDPKRLGRLRAKVPEVLDAVETGWALPCAPMGGPNAGLFAVPPTDALVWIEFEAGDVSRPIWSGCFWNESAAPKDAKGGDAKPTTRVLRSSKGLVVALDDDAETIAISDDSGNNLLVIDVQGGKLTLKATSKIVVQAPAVELVENASSPIVLGDKLLQYLSQIVTAFASHVHPGTAGPFPVTPSPPVTPLPSPTQALLSTKVKSG